MTEQSRSLFRNKKGTRQQNKRGSKKEESLFPMRPELNYVGARKAQHERMKNDPTKKS